MIAGVLQRILSVITRLVILLRSIIVHLPLVTDNSIDQQGTKNLVLYLIAGLIPLHAALR